MSRRHALCRLALTALAWSAAAQPVSASPTSLSVVSVPMTAEMWESPKTTFAASETFPTGLMTVTEGYAVLKGVNFAEGTVEFDMKPLAYSDTGILIHRRDADTAEFVYLRADPDCPAANDCVQYAPVTNGRMQWNTYPQYQHSASISEKGWNHLRLVVADGRLRLFVNGALVPSLDVHKLRGLASLGGIAVKGPAVFANLVVRPNDLGESVPSVAGSMRSGTVGQWLLGPVTTGPASWPPTFNNMPKDGWRPLDAAPDGLANLARAIPPNKTAGREVAWLRLTIDAAVAGDRAVDLGFVPRVRLFLNGETVYTGDNFYYPEDKRLTPAGRFASDNAKLKLSLRKGRNELVLALDDAWRRSDGSIVSDHYGWGAAVRFEDDDDLVFNR